MQQLHIPVLSEVLSSFLPQDRPFSYLDCTVGCGGHARHILRTSSVRHFVGVDRDPSALEQAQRALYSDLPELYSFIHSDFASFSEQAVKKGQSFDFLLLDLGMSSLQLDHPERGFSYRFRNAPLDMRMNPHDPLSALSILQSYSERELSDLFFRGEVPRSRQLARALCIYRKKKPIETVEHLLEAVHPVLKKNRSLHPATLLFQALRMEVNSELDQLQSTLSLLPQLLSPEGVAAILSFHSLEDRMVKHSLKNQQQKGDLAILTKKPLGASSEEKRKNKRSRSAKLRVACRLLHTKPLP
ncbi:16S rRNA (cytosine(1402)-N(4))-methyltransferase RsmH [Candidatus Similichlamydia laticola]|uniref:Ribosomal RNA small subunit methyltransferase H n=1 Tax=Candidatus Similichlamydia laticola TaxID=2170265 RepID=A0A369KAW3_9BACT|nr:16S rRNA (cytosine(1402)-N(4))-methyltransferase RsmH [Candidatus Similichlamydia laticola]RDB31749.1 rRNA small subunit methyltransferase H [Candidatus Similichlamydia laticola]